MDLLQVKVIGDQLAQEYPHTSRELILLSVMRVLREHEACTKEELRAEIEAEIKRFLLLHPSSIPRTGDTPVCKNAEAHALSSR